MLVFRCFALIFTFALMLSFTPARAEWREATSEHFVVVSEGNEQSLIRAAQRLEAVHWLMTAATRANTAENGARVKIYLVRGIAEVHRAMGVGANNEAAGFYRPGIEGAIAVVPRDQSSFSNIILYHEYAHHFMLQYMRSAFPPWYVEGFAEVVSTANFQREGQISYGYVAEHRSYELSGEPWVPVARMMAPRSADDDEAGVASYGQYWLAAHYFLFTQERRGQLVQYISALNQGRSHEQAAAAFTGGMEQLDNDLRSYLRRNRFSYLPVPLPANIMVAPTVRVLPPGEGAIIDLELQASRYLTTEENVALANRIGEVVSRFPDDAAVSALHARALLDAERYDEAEIAADRALAIAPNHPRALVYKGLAMLHARKAADGEMDAAFVRQARGHIIRANRDNPNDQMPLIAYYRSFELAGQTPPDLAVDGLYRASRLVPQEPGLRMEVAGQLINRRNITNARILLAPLAQSPHASNLQQQALLLVQWIDDGATGDPPVYTPPSAVAVEGD